MTPLATALRPSSLPSAKAIIFDSNGPGAMTFTLTWSRTRRFARCRLRAMIPDLVALYA